MIARFCLYGFLKNLRFFEVFLVLALRERGVDFLGIGTLIAIREIAGNLIQIPSGVLADTFGRKRCMVAGMTCYVLSFLALGLAESTWLMMLAMVLYGTGDAFREGTHKALIYSWLRLQGREEERTRVYGFTRSWSKLGSAVSALGATSLVFITGSYTTVFLLSVIPAALNLVNLATYPAVLDEAIPRGKGVRQTCGHLVEGFRDVLARSPLRRLVRDSIVVEGGCAAVKDYLQVVLQTLAVTLPAMFAISREQRTAVFIGITFFILHLLSSKASRMAHRFEEASGGTEPAVARLKWMTAAAFMLLGFSLASGSAWLAVVCFVGLAVLQNVWRPIHIGRFDRDGEERRAATVLSIESQASSLAVALWAPLIGLMIDGGSGQAGNVPVSSLWPVALAGAPLFLAALPGRGHKKGTGG